MTENTEATPGPYSLDLVISERQPSKAHPIFKNRDLISMILYHICPHVTTRLVAQNISKNTRKSLLSVALISKAFLGPATDLLWRVLDSIMPLLNLLPGFIAIKDVYTISDTITTKHQQILFSYASKVRHLIFNNFCESIKGHVIHRLLNLENPLFPCLRSFYIHSFYTSLGFLGSKSPESSTTFIFLAVSKTLQDIAIDAITPATEDDVVSYLSVLDKQKIPVQYLQLGGRLTDKTLSTPKRFTGLENLSLSFKQGSRLCSTDFWSWSSLPSLTDIKLTFDVTSYFEIDASQPEGLPPLVKFHALEKFTFVGFPVGALSMLKTIQASTALTTIALNFTSQPLSQLDALPPTLFSDCLTECARLSERFKNFELKMPDLERISASLLPVQSILFLSNCKELQRLIITGTVLAIDDSIVHKICSTAQWVNMRILCLPHATRDTTISFHSLVTVARYCPNLTYLQLCMDIKRTTYEALENERTGPSLNHKLQTLVFTQLHSEGPLFRDRGDFAIAVRVAASASLLIAYHFPDLQTENIWLFSKFKVDKDWWKEVLHLIHAHRMLKVEIKNPEREINIVSSVTP